MLSGLNYVGADIIMSSKHLLSPYAAPEVIADFDVLRRAKEYLAPYEPWEQDLVQALDKQPHRYAAGCDGELLRSSSE